METAQDNTTIWMYQPSTGVNWPNFFAVGAVKAGSTFLYRHLKRHPEVFLPTEKELMFFQPERSDSTSLDDYRALYAEANGYKAVGEITPHYLIDPNVPSRIHEVAPGAKIIIVLRDPVERAYAHYWNERRYFWDSGSFREAVQRYEDASEEEERRRNMPEMRWRSQNYIEEGLYFPAVRPYLDTFGSDQVLVLMFEDLNKNSNALLMRVAAHIGVDPGFFDGLDVSENPNPYRMPKSRAILFIERHGLARWVPSRLRHAARPFVYNLKKPRMDDESRRRLQQIYDPDITRLEELLGRKLPELRKSWI